VTLHERAIMFKWLVAWAERYQQREIKRLREEGRRLKEEVMKLDGGEPIPLSPEQRRLLQEKAKAIDPEVLKQTSVLDFQDANPQCPNDTSTESP
jgi:hypothetical protein